MTDLINTRMLSHISFDSGGELNYETEIKCSNHIMNGKKIYKTTWTPKEGFMVWGKPEITFHCPMLPKKSYKTIQGLLRALNLPKLKKQQ